MVPESAPPADALSLQQWAFLLHHAASAANGTLTFAALTKKLTGFLQHDLALSHDAAAKLCTELVQAQLLEIPPKARSRQYRITEAGRAKLREIERHIPLAPLRRKGEVTEVDTEALRAAREAFLLKQLLPAPREGATLGELQANRGYGPEKLRLNAATARRLRSRYVADGWVRVIRSARSEKYALTADGVARLARLPFDEFSKVEIAGGDLTRLLAAARGTPAAATAPGATHPEGPFATPADVERAVWAAFDRLLRERHFVTGLVPIHEVRAEVRRALGDAAAAHAVFDEAAFRLWRSKRVKLVSISDRGRATPEQLADAIPDGGETFFYLASASHGDT